MWIRFSFGWLVWIVISVYTEAERIGFVIRN